MMNWTSLFDLSILESHKDERTRFDRDYDRIIFSHPFRRLQDKTQVHPLPEYDFVHNRLTHSLEVSSVGRSLGRAVGYQVLDHHPELTPILDPADFGTVVASASLAHDIGNPPFGHSGESSISDYFKSRKTEMANDFSQDEWADLENFEGNAQGFRLIAKSSKDGLKLTLPTIAAFTKYPRPSKIHHKRAHRRSQKKFGYFQSEESEFQHLASKLELSQIGKGSYLRHPLAFLVEAADDICYHIIDLEDGCNLGLVPPDQAIHLLSNILGSRFRPDKLKETPLLKDQLGLLRALAISTLVNECVEVFMDNESQILSGEFDMALADQIRSTKVLEEIIGISVSQIYRSQKVVEIEAAGYEVLMGLLEVFVPAVVAEFKAEISYRHQLYLRLIPADYSFLIKKEKTLYGRIRVLLDFVSGMTDSYAVSLFRKIKGTALPGRH